MTEVAIRKIFAEFIPTIRLAKQKPPPKCATRIEGEPTTAERAWLNSLTEKQRDAIRAWQSSQYDAIREAQLFEGEGTSEIRAHLKNLKSAWKKAPKHKGTVHRGMRMDWREARAKFKFGTEMEMESFTASSVKDSIAKKFANWDSVVSEELGGPGGMGQARILFDVKSKSGRQIWAAGREDELEVLFGQGSRFRIVKVKPEQFVSVEGKNVRLNRLTVMLEEI